MATENTSIGSMILGTAISLGVLFGIVWVAGKAWKTATN
jgi:hypothetical protein